jgi:hypothetical protein
MYGTSTPRGPPGASFLGVLPAVARVNYTLLGPYMSVVVLLQDRQPA